jgi:colicin import membrane protein
MTDATPYTVPKEPGRWRAITLAALVHAALLVFLWIGIRWQNETPVVIEAEVWSPQTREAAPLPQPAPEPEPTPVVKETPKPEVKEPPVVKPEPPVAKPDIALEQEKKRKAEEKRLEDERLAKKKAEEEKLAKKKEEDERLKKQKQKEEEEQLAKKKAEDKLRAEKEAQTKKAAAEKKRKEEEAEEKLLAKAREEEMRRIAGGVTGSGGAGDAPKSQGGRGDASYLQKVAARIKSNTIFNVSDDIAGNSAVEYAVELLPDGSLRGEPRKLKSSNVPGFDEAVLRGIVKSQPFPRDEKSGSVPSRFDVSYKPKELVKP